MTDLGLQQTPNAAGLAAWYVEHLSRFDSNQLAINEVGVPVTCRFSVPGMPLRSIGYFRLPAGPDDPDVELVRREGERLLRQGHGESLAPVYPGMRAKIIQVVVDGRQLYYYLNADAPLPVEIEPIEAALRRLMARAAPFPRATLSMQVELEPKTVHVGDELEIAVDFRASGRFAVVLANPAMLVPPTAGSFRLNFYRATRDPDEPYDYGFTLDLVGRELQIAERRTLKSLGPAPTIDVGTTIRAWTKLPLPRCRAASYLVQLIYSFPRPSRWTDGDDRDFGTFHSDGVPLTVLKRK